MSLTHKAAARLQLRPRPRSPKRKSLRSAIPRWLGGSKAPSRPLPRTPPTVIYIPELPSDSEEEAGEGEVADDDDLPLSCRSLFSSTASSRRSDFAHSAPSLARRTGDKLHTLVHRALGSHRQQALEEASPRRSSVIKALAIRLSSSSVVTTMSSSTFAPDSRSGSDDDDCAELEEAILSDEPARSEFLFFAGCPDNLNVYELEVNQYRRRTNFTSATCSTKPRAPSAASAAEAIAVGPTIVRSMPPLFTPRLVRTVSSDLLDSGRGAAPLDEC